MAPGAPPPNNLSFAVAKKVLSADDIERLACAFLATDNIYAFDKNKAANEFGGSKPDSFKRQIWVITKKIKEAQESGEVGTPVKAKTKGGGRKRKTNEGDDDDDEDTEATPKTKRKTAKKSRAEVKEENGNDAHMLVETAGGAGLGMGLGLDSDDGDLV